MTKEIYESPAIFVVSVTAEGPLCSSPATGGNPLVLPDVEWKGEAEW